MNLDSISALMEALKRHEGASKGKLDLGKPVAARISVVKAVPAEGDNDDALTMMKGMGRAVDEMGHEKELRDYAPPPISPDDEYDGADAGHVNGVPHHEIVAHMQATYPEEFQRIIDDLRG